VSSEQASADRPAALPAGVVTAIPALLGQRGEGSVAERGLARSELGSGPLPTVALGQRALPCLVAASIWAAPSAFWPVADQAALRGLDYLALVGCGSFGLWLVALSWPGRHARSATRKWQAALSLGLGLALAPWSALGYWILVATHHRPLGAVTFAVGAAVIALACVATARWCLALASARPHVGKPLLVAATLLAVASGGGAVWLLARAGWADAALGALLFQVALGVLLALLVLAAPVGGRAGAAGRWALPVCACVWLATLWLVRSDADVRATVKSTPILAGIVGLTLR
jgi:hypothetical protein